jgi:hypothetical protein
MIFSLRPKSLRKAVTLRQGSPKLSAWRFARKNVIGGYVAAGEVARIALTRRFGAYRLRRNEGKQIYSLGCSWGCSTLALPSAKSNTPKRSLMSQASSSDCFGSIPLRTSACLCARPKLPMPHAKLRGGIQRRSFNVCSAIATTWRIPFFRCTGDAWTLDPIRQTPRASCIRS